MLPIDNECFRHRREMNEIHRIWGNLLVGQGVGSGVVGGLVGHGVGSGVVGGFVGQGVGSGVVGGSVGVRMGFCVFMHYWKFDKCSIITFM